MIFKYSKTKILVLLTILPFFAFAQFTENRIYEPKGVGGGGALSGFNMSPYSDVWMTGSDLGTAYRSVTDGYTWYPVSHTETTFSNDLPNAAYFGFNPDSNIVFHTYEGCKPERSTDGGLTWQAITSLQNLLPTTGYDLSLIHI